MNQKSNKIFKDSHETIKMYYRYLHLGYFYSQLSKHEDLSCKSRNIWIDFDTNKFLLKKDVFKNSLKDMYKKSQSLDFFSLLILSNSSRGITMALFEALKDAKIKNLFLEHIFRNDEEAYNNFDGVVRFIRNTFSHNIRDRIELRKEDYEKQINYLSKNKKDKPTLNFFFDYATLFPNIKNYTVKINIDFNKIKEGDVYINIIPEYQTLLFIELCYNCMEYLNELD